MSVTLPYMFAVVKSFIGHLLSGILSLNFSAIKGEGTEGFMPLVLLLTLFLLQRQPALPARLPVVHWDEP